MRRDTLDMKVMKSTVKGFLVKANWDKKKAIQYCKEAGFLDGESIKESDFTVYYNECKKLYEEINNKKEYELRINKYKSEMENIKSKYEDNIYKKLCEYYPDKKQLIIKFFMGDYNNQLIENLFPLFKEIEKILNEENKKTNINNETNQINEIEKQLICNIMTCGMDSKSKINIAIVSKKIYYDYMSDNDISLIKYQDKLNYIIYMHCRLAVIRKIKRLYIDKLKYNINSLWDAYIKVFLLMSNLYLPEKIFTIDKDINLIMDKLKINKQDRKLILSGISRKELDLL